MFKKIFFITLSFLLIHLSVTAQDVPNLAASSYAGAAPPSIVLPTPYNMSPNNLNSSSKFNYVRTFSPKVPYSLSSSASIDESSIKAAVSTTTSYTNGWGQTILNITSGAVSLDSDIVQPFDLRLASTGYTYLPYASADNLGKFKLSPFLDQKTYYDNLYPSESHASYSQSLYQSDKFSRSTISCLPGKSSANPTNGVKTIISLNGGNQIINWTVDAVNFLPVNAGYYPAGSLSVKTTTNSDGAHLEEYTDKDGKIICRIEYRSYGSCGTSSCPTTLTTYYVYDDLSRLTFTIPPKAVDYLIAGGTSTSMIVNNLCFTQKYDQLDRLIEIGNPEYNGAGPENVVYDLLGRKVLYQTPELKRENKWEFNIFDNKNRLIANGIFTDTYGDTRAYLQAVFDGNATLPSSLVNDANYPLSFMLKYSNDFSSLYSSYNTLTEQFNIIKFYDDYDAISSWGWLSVFPYTYDASELAGYLSTIPSAINPSLSNKTIGKMTACITKSIGSTTTTNDKMYSVYYYDQYGRLLQERDSNNHGVKINTSVQYNFSGQPLVSVVTVNNPNSASKPTTQIAYSTWYSDGVARVGSESVNIDNSGWRTIKSEDYDGLNKCTSQLIGGGVELQQYSYNIRSKLMGINANYAETGLTDGYPISFGESIKYDYGFAQNYLGDRISGLVWKGAGTSPSRAYGYTYDLTGRLINADFSEYTTPSGSGSPSWNKLTSDYTVSNIQYDDNGNLATMNQKGMAMVPVGGIPTISIVDIDNLTYSYKNNGVSNNLDRIEDAVSVDYHLGDFQNKNVGSQDYTFDNNGNLTEDLNKNITSITYNFLNLPDHITFALSGGGTGTIDYVYDAKGTKLSQTTFDGTSTNTLSYAGPLVFLNNDIDYMTMSNGRARYHSNSSGMMFWDFDFFVKDHLGNVRTVLNASPANDYSYYASHELSSAHIENLTFSNEGPVRAPKPGSTDPTDQEAAQLLGTDPSKRVGTAILLQVMTGDKFSLSAESYYTDTVVTPPAVNPSDMLNSIISTLIGGQGGFQGQEGNGATYVQNMFTPNNYLGVYDGIKNAATDPDVPRAYLNYIFFDQNYQIVPALSGAIQIGGTPDSWQSIGSNTPINITQNGYLSVYISSEDSRVAYIDNINLNHYVGGLMEENHYYPFGLSVNDGTLPVTEHRFLYQGKEYQDEMGLNLQDFRSRQYDPQIGRFINADPMHQGSSPYVSMLNNPISNTDPSGKYVGYDDAIAFTIGALVNLAVQAYYGNIHSIAEGADYFVAGGLSGEVSLYDPAMGGAVLNIGNSIVQQVNTTGEVDANILAKQALLGYVTAGAGAELGSALEPVTNNIFSEVSSPILKNSIQNAVGTSAVSFGVTTGTGLAQGKSLNESLKAGANTIPLAFTLGFITGAARGVAEARAADVNPFTGKPNNLPFKPTPLIHADMLDPFENINKPRTFYSGDGAWKAAADFSVSKNALTIEQALMQTETGQQILDYLGTMSAEDARPYWAFLSAKFAAGATGTVYFMMGPNMHSANIWITVEQPILNQTPGVLIDVHTFNLNLW